MNNEFNLEGEQWLQVERDYLNAKIGEIVVSNAGYVYKKIALDSWQSLGDEAGVGPISNEEMAGPLRKKIYDGRTGIC